LLSFIALHAQAFIDVRLLPQAFPFSLSFCPFMGAFYDLLVRAIDIALKV
jgi:hypothetical protein